MTVVLIRHAHTDVLGRRLSGREPGVTLSARGTREAAALAGRMASFRLDAIFSSPLCRARQTAAPLAHARGLDVQVHEGINEMDFGAWTGLDFTELAKRPDWQQFNGCRATAVVPGGESPAAMQMRAVAAVREIAAAAPAGVTAIVTHADVIRSIVLDALGLSLNAIHAIAVDPASITAIEYAGSVRLLFLNCGAPQEGAGAAAAQLEAWPRRG